MEQMRSRRISVQSTSGSGAPAEFVAMSPSRAFMKTKGRVAVAISVVSRSTSRLLWQRRGKGGGGYLIRMEVAGGGGYEYDFW
jgi:hypothetical protein